MVGLPQVGQSAGQSERVAKWLKSKQSEAGTLGLKTWYIKVEWLDIVKF